MYIEGLSLGLKHNGMLVSLNMGLKQANVHNAYERIGKMSDLMMTLFEMFSGLIIYEPKWVKTVHVNSHCATICTLSTYQF